MKILFGAITAVAFVLMLGTIGALDTGLISLATATTRMCVGLPIMITAFVIARKV